MEIRDRGISSRDAISEGEQLIRELAADLEKESVADEKRRKLLTLLPDCDENLAKMSAIVEKNKKKLISLHEQWENHVASMEAEYEKLCHDASAQEVKKSSR